MHGPKLENGVGQRQHVYHNLPLQPTPLVGRGREVETVAAMLRRADMRLLTLIGPPGIGKTRLAIHTAANLLDDFAGGIWMVTLAAITDPDLVVSAIAQTLELRGSSDEHLVERLESYLQDKNMLLLLDNFEQVITAAPLLADLLAHCPGVKLLVTSRELLHLYGEHDYPVPPLSLPDQDSLPDLQALSQYEAIGLFMQRAQAVSPGFQLTERNAAAVAEICLRLDGLPLAIELAAARILVLPPEELLARLKNRLRLLTGGARNLPERQRTLQAAIDWSYNLLDEGEQALFRSLGVFVDGCTLGAIEEVCGGEPGLDTLDGVASLVGKSLLQRQEATSDEPRFMMLETIREYAREKLEAAGDLESMSDRHLDYFVRLAENAERVMSGDEWPSWLRRLDAEQNNLRAALEWSVSRDGRAQMGLRLAGALARYWQDRAYLSEGKQWCAQLLRKTEPAESSVERAKALRGLGRMYFEQGDFAEARSIYEESLEMSRALGDDLGASSTLRGLGAIALWHAEYDLGLSQFEEALAIGRKLENKSLIASALSMKGTILMLMEDHEAAQSSLEESLIIERELGNVANAALTLSTQGSVAFRLGEHEKARSLVEEGLNLARELGVDWVMANCLARLGMIVLCQGEPWQAEEYFVEGLTRARDSGNRRWSRWYLTGLAEIARLRGLAERAATLIGASDGALSVTGAYYEPAMRAEIDRIKASVRAELDEDTLDKLSAEGRAFLPEEIMAFALEPVSDGTVEPAHVPAGAHEGRQVNPDDLTDREVEVLRLIAAGKSNQEIAGTLVLSLRTVERHISNIYEKIGATGRIARATATAYALRHGLAEA